jgi:hypothetical protein
VAGDGHALSAAGGLGMGGDLDTPMTDADPVAGDATISRHGTL